MIRNEGGGGYFIFSGEGSEASFIRNFAMGIEWIWIFKAESSNPRMIYPTWWSVFN